MEPCKHEWLGASNGVHCTRCGVHLTPQAYKESLQKGEKPKPSRKKVER